MSENENAKVHMELIAATYGAFMMELLKDNTKYEDVNAKLEEIGAKIGVRLIDEFFARSGPVACACRKDVAEKIAQAFKIFLGVVARVGNFQNEDKEFTIFFGENPLTDFVELPETSTPLIYSNLLCGVLKGALRTLNIVAKCVFLKEKLKGDEENQIQVIMEEEIPDVYDDNEG